jgi:hypothetical protein
MPDTPEKTLPQVCEEIGLRLEIYKKPRDVADISVEKDVADISVEKNGDKEWKHYAYSVGVCLDHNVMPPIPYKLGVGHVVKLKERRAMLKPPQVADVIYSLVMESSATDTTFEDWCSDCGYDTDSRKALEMYLLCQENGIKIRKLLGKHFAAVRDAAQNY